MMQCEACGATIPAGINVCIDCGKKTDGGSVDPDLVLAAITARHGGNIAAPVYSRAQATGSVFDLVSACLTALGWTLIAGVSSFGFACWLRLNAQSLAWPDKYRFSGEREHTVWAVREQAYQDIAMWLALLGVALIVVAALRWRGGRSED